MQLFDSGLFRIFKQKSHKNIQITMNLTFVSDFRELLVVVSPRFWDLLDVCRDSLDDCGGLLDVISPGLWELFDDCGELGGADGKLFCVVSPGFRKSFAVIPPRFRESPDFSPPASSENGLLRYILRLASDALINFVLNL